MGLGDFWDGYHNRSGSHLIIRSLKGRVDYQTGRRLGRSRTRVAGPVGDLWAQSAGFFKASLVCAVLGMISGFGYGLWQPFTDQWSPGLGADAMTVLKWTGIGAGAGALVPSAVIVAACVAVLGAVLWGLALLLDFLTSL